MSNFLLLVSPLKARKALGFRSGAFPTPWFGAVFAQPARKLASPPVQNGNRSKQGLPGPERCERQGAGEPKRYYALPTFDQLDSVDNPGLLLVLLRCETWDFFLR